MIFRIIFPNVCAYGGALFIGLVTQSQAGAMAGAIGGGLLGLLIGKRIWP